MLSYKQYLIEKILSDNEYETLVKSFKVVWNEFDKVRREYREGKIDRNEFVKYKEKFDLFQKKYNESVI